MKRLYVTVLFVGLLTIGMFGIAMDRAAAFTTVPDPNIPPVADAGADQFVNEDSPVTLHGSKSYDYDGDDLTFSWTQVLGPDVDLLNPLDPMPSFTAPLSILEEKSWCSN